ncbi:MAG: hyaD 1 [Mucilaginibacter sp.]|nr:hyaD 1 [Mucilaginibacter sp.]
MPHLTVLIPTYNCGKYIEECIISVINQKYTDYELIIIDDGSNDNTEEIVNNINDKRIAYLKNPVNMGIVATLNRGLDIAKGKYIARMDADDIMLGNRLGDQVDFLDQNADYGMVGGWYQIIDENGALLKTLETSSDAEFLKLGLLFRNQFAHPSVTMRTDLARKLRYDQNYIYCEDHDLWIRFAEVSKVMNLPRLYLTYRWYGNNTCHIKQKELKLSVLKLLGRELDKIDIAYNTTELMLHAAVCFGVMPLLLRKPEKHSELKGWLDKILSSPVLKANYDESVLQDLIKRVYLHCGISEEMVTFYKSIDQIKKKILETNTQL